MKRLAVMAITVFLCGWSGVANSATFDADTMVNAADYGVVGDGVTDSRQAFADASTAANAAGKNVYVPDGNYVFSNGVHNGGAARLIGQSKAGTVITSTFGVYKPNISGAKDITFVNIQFNDNGTGTSRVYENCIFNIYPNSGAYYAFNIGAYVVGANVVFDGCDFNYDVIYIAIRVYDFQSVRITNCTFNGYASHPVRIDPPVATNYSNVSIDISGNTVTGGKTGIFVGSNRVSPIENGVIQNNTLYGQTEESIGLDGFGNNAGLVPTICNGIIDNVTNDGNGKLVVGATMVYHDGATTNQPCPLTLRNDWTNFYATLGQGTGQGGTYAKVIGYDNAAGTITMDSLVSADDVDVSGDFGIQSGFFNWIIRDNRISNSYGAGGTYATAISLWLNSFGALVDNNTVTNCANGIAVAGGLMLSTYQVLAWNNIVSNNTFDNILVPAHFRSAYTGHTQYGNQFTSNTIIGGSSITFTQQDNLTISGNTYTGNAGNDNLIYFKAEGACTKFSKGTPTINGVSVPQAVCVAANDGSGNGIWSAVGDSIVRALIETDANYRGIGLDGANAISAADKNLIATGTQHTFMGWSATTGALQ